MSNFLRPHGYCQAVSLSLGFATKNPRVAISFSRASSLPRDQTPVSCIGSGILYYWGTLSVSYSVILNSLTPRTAAHQAPLPMRFSRQGYWSGLPFPSPGHLPTQGSNPVLLHCRQILYQLSYKRSPPEKPQTILYYCQNWSSKLDWY